MVTLRPPRTGNGLTLAAGCHQQSHPPFGLAGGLAARPTEARMDGAAVPVAETSARLGALPFDAGAPTVALRTAGGGGHGSPVDRPVEAVLRDVRDELLSVREALDVLRRDGRPGGLAATREA